MQSGEDRLKPMKQAMKICFWDFLRNASNQAQRSSPKTGKEIYEFSRHYAIAKGRGKWCLIAGRITRIFFLSFPKFLFFRMFEKGRFR